MTDFEPKTIAPENVTGLAVWLCKECVGWHFRLKAYNGLEFTGSSKQSMWDALYCAIEEAEKAGVALE